MTSAPPRPAAVPPSPPCFPSLSLLRSSVLLLSLFLVLLLTLPFPSSSSQPSHPPPYADVDPAPASPQDPLKPLPPHPPLSSSLTTPSSYPSALDDDDEVSEDQAALRSVAAVPTQGNVGGGGWVREVGGLGGR